MPDPGLQPPYLDPSQYPAYLDLQRKQMLASALMQNTQQAGSTPAEWNSMRVVPRKSALSTVTALASALMAGKSQKDLMGAQGNYFQGLMGGSSPSPTAAAAPSAPPSAPGVAPLTAEMPPTASQPSAIAAQQGGQPTATPAQPNPMLLTGDPRTSQALLTMMGPEEYAKALAGRYAPTDLQKLLTMAGATPEQAQQAARQAVTKQTTIDPIAARPGTALIDPTTNKPVFYNPSAPEGSMPQFGPNGMPSGIVPLPGGTEAIAAEKGAQTAGEVSNKYSILPTAGGGSTVVGGPHTGLPGAPAGPTAPTPGRQAPRVAQPSGVPSAPTPQGWEGMPKLPVSSAIGAPDAFTHGRLQAAGAKDAELSSQYGKESDLADQKMQYNTDARKVLESAEVGPSSEWLTENRARLLEWGVPESLVPGSGAVTPTLELNKVLKQSALQGARQIFGSRMTQNEVQLQHEQLSPSPSMTRDAIKSLMRQDDIKQMYAKQRADDYGKYIQAKGDPLRFESWYSKTHPLTEFAQQQEGATAEAPKPAAAHQFTPDEIQAEMKRRGLSR